MPAKRLKKELTREKKADISDYEIQIRYIPLPEEEENQRIRQLCFLLYQETIEDLRKSSD